MTDDKMGKKLNSATYLPVITFCQYLKLTSDRNQAPLHQSVVSWQHSQS